MGKTKQKAKGLSKNFKQKLKHSKEYLETGLEDLKNLTWCGKILFRARKHYVSATVLLDDLMYPLYNDTKLCYLFLYVLFSILLLVYAPVYALLICFLFAWRIASQAWTYFARNENFVLAKNLGTRLFQYVYLAIQFSMPFLKAYSYALLLCFKKIILQFTALVILILKSIWTCIRLED